jgi:hypothetical protein
MNGKLVSSRKETRGAMLDRLSNVHAQIHNTLQISPFVYHSAIGVVSTFFCGVK